MELSQKGMAKAFGFGWGGAMLVAGLGHLIFFPYGQSFLQVIGYVNSDVVAKEHGKSVVVL